MLRFRWTISMAASELHVDPKRLRQGMREGNIEPGPDGKYSTHQIFLAASDFARLEQQAKEAKLRQVIDEAEMAKLKRGEQEGRLVPLQSLVNWHLDLLTEIVSFVRHSKLPEEGKQQLIRQVTEYEYAPTGNVVPLRQGIQSHSASRESSH